MREILFTKAETLRDNTITLARKNSQEALRMLAEATQYQNVTLENLCSTIAKLCKSLEKWTSEDWLTRSLLPF